MPLSFNSADDYLLREDEPNDPGDDYRRDHPVDIGNVRASCGQRVKDCTATELGATAFERAVRAMLADRPPGTQVRDALSIEDLRDAWSWALQHPDLSPDRIGAPKCGVA